jgi:hypothetical protein
MPSCGARGAVDNDDRPLGVGEEPRRLADCTRVTLRWCRRHIAWDVQTLAVFLDRRLLQTAIERDRDWRRRRGHGDLVGAHKGLREVLQ